MGYVILAVIAVDVVFGLACFRMGSIHSRLEEQDAKNQSSTDGNQLHVRT